MSDLVRHEGASSSMLATMDNGTIDRFGRVAKALAASGYFKDARSVEQAFAKLIFGYDLGLSVTASMTDIHIIEGKPSLSANLQAVKIKQWRGEDGERYRYKILKHTNDGCAIEFSYRETSEAEWEVVGTETFTMEDAKTAGLANKDNWKKHPKNMCFARALSNGCAFYCPEVMEGVRTYSEGDSLDGQQSNGAGDFEARAQDLAGGVVDGPQDLTEMDKPVVPDEPATSDVTTPEMIDAIKEAFPGAEEVAPEEEIAEAEVVPEAAADEGLEALVREKLQAVSEDPAIIEARIRGAKGNPDLLRGLLGYAEQKAANAK